MNANNRSIAIRVGSTTEAVAKDLCTLLMYSDFIAAATESNDLQAFQTVLKENVRDGYAVLKQLSVHSNDINITDHQLQPAAGSGSEINSNSTVEEEIATFRTYCTEQSLLDRFVQEPYRSITQAWPQSCLGDFYQCGWIKRHFGEPERVAIIDEAAINNCSNM